MEEKTERLNWRYHFFFSQKENKSQNCFTEKSNNFEGVSHSQVIQTFVERILSKSFYEDTKTGQRQFKNGKLQLKITHAHLF